MSGTGRKGPVVEPRRAGGRAHTTTDWLDSRHSFSFGAHYDPGNTHFGVLLVSNEDTVRAGTGFDTHPHRDMEIVTWVLDGSLVHQDSEGNAGLLYPGLAQRISAGTGILHSERNDSWPGSGAGTGRVDVHFVQMWVMPDTSGLRPGYEQLEVVSALRRGDTVVVASGMAKHRDERAISIAQRHAALYAVRLRPGAVTTLPSAPFAHLFVARGSAVLEGSGNPNAGNLDTADAVRISGSEGQRVEAGPDGAELLIWEMATELG